MNLNIENKILIPILFLVILPLLAVGIFYYRNSQNLFIKNMEDDIKDDLNEVQNIIRNDYNTSENDLIKRIYSIKEIDLIIYDINTNRLIHNRFGVKDNELLDLMNKEGLSNNEKEFNVTINDRLISFLRIEKFNWYVGTGKEISTLKSSLLEIHKYTILFAIIFLIIAVELSIFLAHNLSKPIKKLTNFCKKVSKRDYQNKIDIKRQDEFGLLANSFNEMIQKINQSTNKLKNLKEFNEDILRSTTTGIISVDQDGEVISINRAAKNILKKESEQEKIFMKLKNMTIKSLNKNERYNKIMEFSIEQVESLIIEVNTSLLTNEEGEINGALCSFNDITQRRKIEERIKEIDRLSSLGEIAAGLAHEIRNPLTGIKTSIEVLENRINDKSSNQLCANVVSEINRMNTLISDILNFSNPKNPQLKLIDVKNIIEETLMLMEEQFKNNNVQIKKKYDQEKLYAKIDPEQLKQILINLYMNAINAISKKGKIEISLRVINENKIKIRIKDDGKGIKDEDISKIFDPFFSTSAKGTGLGLAVVKRLVLENKGKIDIKSVVGKGTNVEIILPKKGDKND